MADKYEINDTTPTENITLEEEASAIPDEASQGERPEWLPEKFNSPEDLARAYSSLESKLGSAEDTGKTEDLPPTEAPTESQVGQTEAIQSASAEWQEKGELSNTTYEALSKAGLRRELVDSYIEGQNALITAEEESLMAVAGGKEAYSAMAEWASEELSETQLEAYNKAIESGSNEQAQLAVDWLKSKHSEANGVNPSLMQGKTQGPSSLPFESRAQVLAAMAERDATGKKKYEVDPAYRKEVERRLAISNV